MRRVVTGLLVGAVLAGCAAPASLSGTDDRVQVVTTTALLRDLVQQVGGDRVNVVSIIPDGADPHSFEPTLRNARDVVYADVAFSNYALLEEHNVVKTLDANVKKGVPNIALAEGAVKYAAEIISLVENLNLDTIWLGLRAIGDGAEHGATRASDVVVSATAAQGPGEVYGYLTGSFGDTDVYFDSSNGFDASNGYKDDSAILPADAHTHMSWVFTKPGIYTVSFVASLRVDQTSRPIPMGEARFTFAVGVNPNRADIDDPVVLDQGHADLAVDLDAGEIVARYDPGGGGDHTQETYRAEQVVIEVPSKALTEIPSGQQYRFLGRPGTQVYQLPQAVLGKHVHGEIDPHLWQNVRNAMAYVELIRDTLIGVDPAGASEYRKNADAYLAELERLDAYVRDQIASIPADRRYLITTHDAFGYLAHAYAMTVAGFVTPNPAAEPSLADRRKLASTIDDLDVPAVFLEPNLRARSSTLTEVAKERGVQVCPIYSDAFDDQVDSYIDMMRFNADSLVQCLTQENP